MRVLGAFVVLFLVLTGTTGFPLLEQGILSLAKQAPDIEFWVQSKNDIEQIDNITHSYFIDMDRLETSRLSGVVGHCGAGTVFWALERRLPLLTVVDLTRPDGHQEDLGAWVAGNHFGMVITNRAPSVDDLRMVVSEPYTTYEPEPFRITAIDRFLQ